MRMVVESPLEIAPMLNAIIPMRVGLNGVGTPLVLICQIAERLHDGELDFMVWVV